ncbi:melanocyte-stimulating hormone receptor-like [Stylophora pistillata]|uniref:melanocyte-stimulating hormone receptor-like n=1 Tax=Stylophora pistillata TaxID=50429 RepID=UPI000C05297D|nr:melanocyte-stimulating hormone receptor-like [Stylophora pistillata]
MKANISGAGNNSTFHEMLCSSYLTIEHRYILLPINLFISATAFPGNVLIIIALQRVSSLHSSSKLLFICLASTDVCVGLILQPVYISYFMSPDNSVPCYYIGDMSYMLSIIFCGVSVQTSTAISVDRLFALLLGLRYRHIITLKRVWIFVIAAWFTSTSNAIFYYYNEAASMYFACTALLLSITTSTFCYVQIYRFLLHHQIQIQEYAPKELSNRGSRLLNIARYKKTVSSAVWIQAALLVCYLPFVIMTTIYVTSEEYTPIIAFLLELTISFVQLNSSLNPFLYCWKIREVRRSVKNLIRGLFVTVC